MDIYAQLFNNLVDIEIIRNVLQSEAFRKTIFGLKVFSAAVSISFVGAIYYFLKTSTFLNTKLLDDVSDFVRVGMPITQKQFIQQWEALLTKLETNNEANWKLAIVEADNILDKILKNTGYKGETMGERLKQLESIHLANLDEVLEAHRIRNLVVHDPDYQLNHGNARRIIDIYKRAFENFELL